MALKEKKRTIVDDFKNISLKTKRMEELNTDPITESIVQTTKRMIGSPVPTPTSPHRYIVDDYFHQREKSVSPDPYYIKKQPELEEDDRHQMADWLVRICFKLKMDNEVLHLAINIMDRYMSIVRVPRDRLFLITITALFISSKYHDDDHICALDLLHLVKYKYKYNDLIVTEQHVMKILKFDLGIGTAHHFLMLYVKAANDMIPSQISVAEYLCDLAQVRADFLVHTPSMIAASALRVTRDFYRLAWNDKIICCSGYAKQQTNECSMKLMVQHGMWNTYRSVQKKYNKERTYYASRIALKNVMITVV